MNLPALSAKYHELIGGALCAAMVFGGLEVAEHIWGFHVPLLVHVLFEIPIFGFATWMLKRRESTQRDLAELTKAISERDARIDDVLAVAEHSRTITSHFSQMQSGHRYDSAINEAIRGLERDHDGATLLQLIENTSEKMCERVEEDPQWRVILERLWGAWHASITGNTYTLSLETYCNNIIDAIRVGLFKANTRKLVVLSFTNVTPKDWFLDPEVIGRPLRRYAAKVEEVVRSMKADGHVFQRFVLCKGDGISADPNSMLGFPGLRDVRLDWANCNRAERNVYLHDYHTAVECAELISLDLPGLRFYQNCTEFVFFGFTETTDQAKSLDSAVWWWCFCAGYTRNNVNVSASFFNLAPGAPSHSLIDIPNTAGIVDRATLITPKKLTIAFTDFPNFMLTLRSSLSTRQRFANLLTLAQKWQLASEIWHSQKEESLLLSLVAKEVPDKKSTILDSACGTGFHAVILKANGYNVTASDKDLDSLRIFERAAAEKSITIDTCHADWKKLSSDLDGRTFDAILCLGSSLPYYKTWQEDTNGTTFDEAELQEVLKNFQRCLKPHGKLIIGLSRHINKQYSKTDLTFNPKNIRHSLSDARDDEYVMRWEFRYDWAQRRRDWYCDIRNQHGDDYSFDIVSHLFDIHELHECCKAVFGATNASIEDPDIEN